jgi:hypothetical protein
MWEQQERWRRRLYAGSGLSGGPAEGAEPGPQERMQKAMWADDEKALSAELGNKESMGEGLWIWGSLLERAARAGAHRCASKIIELMPQQDQSEKAIESALRVAITGAKDGVCVVLLPLLEPSTIQNNLVDHAKMAADSGSKSVLEAVLSRAARVLEPEERAAILWSAAKSASVECVEFALALPGMDPWDAAADGQVGILGLARAREWSPQAQSCAQIMAKAMSGRGPIRMAAMAARVAGVMEGSEKLVAGRRYFEELSHICLEAGELSEWAKGAERAGGVEKAL